MDNLNNASVLFIVEPEPFFINEKSINLSQRSCINVTKQLHSDYIFVKIKAAKRTDTILNLLVYR